MNKELEGNLTGDSEYPYHVSVGVIAVKENEIPLIKREGLYILPKETILADESLTETAKRGLKEEIGAEGRVLAYLGNRDYDFDKKGIHVYKSVLYFLLEVTDIGERIPEINEENDEIVWVSIEEAKELLDKSMVQAGWEAKESAILDRI